jgi:hypothetical protein
MLSYVISASCESWLSNYYREPSVARLFRIGNSTLAAGELAGAGQFAGTVVNDIIHQTCSLADESAKGPPTFAVLPEWGSNGTAFELLSNGGAKALEWH